MRLPGIFALPPEDGPTAPGHIYHFSKRATNTLWTQQRMRNVDMLLDVIRIFVVPENPSTSVNQRVMYQAKMLEALLEVTLASDTPPFIRAGVCRRVMCQAILQLTRAQFVHLRSLSLLPQI